MPTLVLASLAAFVLGLSRGGLKGIAPVFVLMMTIAYGGKQAAGVIVPLLILGDIFALRHYRNYIRKEYIIRFLPFVIIGLLIGAWLGKDMSEVFFKKWIIILIGLSIVILWIWEQFLKDRMTSHPVLNSLLGIGAGFYSMMGNFAGAFATMYFLLTRLPKNELIGTATFVFFIGNLIKLPFHIYIWETISQKTLEIDLYLTPSMLLGFWVGAKIVAIINEVVFRRFLYAVTLLGMLYLLF